MPLPNTVVIVTPKEKMLFDWEPTLEGNKAAALSYMLFYATIALREKWFVAYGS